MTETIHEINKGDRVRIDGYQNGLGLNGKVATVTASNRSGYYLQVDGIAAIVHLTNLEGVQCLTKLTNLTSAQESVPDSSSLELEPDLPSKDSPKATTTAQKYSTSDTPELQTMATSTKSKRGKPPKSTSSPPVLPASPSPSKATDSDNKIPETVSPKSKPRSSKSNPTTGRSKTSPDFSRSITETILDGQSSTGLTTAGTMSNGLLSAADTLEPPIADKDCLFLESPGALGEGISGTNPPGQTRLEGQLKTNGLIDSGEVSNPEFLEASLGLPVGWTDPQDDRTATELLAATEPPESAAKPSEISSIPGSQPSQSIAFSTTIYQLDLTTNRQWISPDQLEEVSFTQIRDSMDGEAISRYAELMQSDLWDFERTPLPVLFNHENRYLVGDGHHRIEAARKIGRNIFCEIFPALQIEEALLYSIKAIENNQHGLPLRPKDQRKRITMFLDLLESGKTPIALPEGYQEWSSRAISTYLRLPESGYRTIANIRKERERLPEEPILKQGTKPKNTAVEPLESIVETTASIEEMPQLSFPSPAISPPSIQSEFTSLSDHEVETDNHKVDVSQLVEALAWLSNDDIAQLTEAIESEKSRRLRENEKGL